MARAVWNGHVLAESAETEVVEGRHYFPPNSVNSEYLAHSGTSSVCPWKGTASYYHISVDGDVVSDAAWYYPDPKRDADNIRGYVAFWKGVEIVD